MTALSRLRLAAFAAPAIPLAALSIPLNVFLPAYYARTVGLDLATVGAIFFAARMWDVVVDPAVGWMSDRTRTRWGRRRPWILAAAPVLLAFTPILFMPGALAGEAQLLLSLLGIYVGYSMLMIPHLSWAAELPGEQDQARAQTYIAGATAVGVVLALAGPFAADQLAPGALSPELLLAGFIMLTGPLAAILAGLIGKEGALARDEAQDGPGLLSLLRDPGLLRLLVADLAYAMAIGGTATLFVFFVEGILAHGSSTGLLLVFYGSAIASTPAWLWLTGRAPKAATASLAAAASAACCLAWPLIAGLAETPGFALAPLVHMAVFGALAGNIVALIRALVGERAQADATRTGRAATGAYFALFSITGKLGMALATAMAFFILDALEVDPKALVGASRTAFYVAFAVAPAVAFGIVAASLGLPSRRPAPQTESLHPS